MAVEIEITDKDRYRIYADRYNVTLQRGYYSKKYKEWKWGNDKTHHANFGEAMRKIVREQGQRLAVGDNNTVVTLLEMHERLELIAEKVFAKIEALPQEVLDGLPTKSSKVDD